MKKMAKYLAYITILLFLGLLIYAQEQTVDRVTVPFSNPSKPGKVEVSVHNGSITVKGYEGKEVIVEAKTRGKTLQETEISKEAARTIARELERVSREDKRLQAVKEKQEEKKASLKGMRLIAPAGGTGLEVEEEDNEMEISASTFRQTVDLTIQVPYHTSLELGAHMNGDIVVENVSGEIEVNNHTNSIKLTGISGSAVAHTHSGEILITFKSVTPDKSMSFSTWAGDIDVTFPSNIKANLKMKSEQGEVYSDFDIQLDKTPQKSVEEKEGKYRVSFEKFIMGTVNGGGSEFQFNTYAGNIIIRKAK